MRLGEPQQQPLFPAPRPRHVAAGLNEAGKAADGEGRVGIHLLIALPLPPSGELKRFAALPAYRFLAYAKRIAWKSPHWQSFFRLRQSFACSTIPRVTCSQVRLFGRFS